MLGSSWVAAQLAASQEGPSSMSKQVSEKSNGVFSNLAPYRLVFRSDKYRTRDEKGTKYPNILQY
jgi:hypothetical protein